MRRHRPWAAALLVVLSGGLVPAGAKAAACSSDGYDDRCERRALWVTSRMPAIWPPQYSHSTGTLVVGGSDYRDDGSGTIAAAGLDTRTGRRRWSFLYDDPVHVTGIGKDVTLSRDGSVAFVTGLSRADETHYDWVTVALAARTGRLLWKKRFGGRGPDVPWQVLADPRRDAVYVAGEITKKDGGGAVVAYDASSGRRLWKRERGSRRYGYDVVEIMLRDDDLYVLEESSCSFEGCEAGPMLTRSRPTRAAFNQVWTTDLADDGSTGYVPGSIEASETRAFVVGIRETGDTTEFVVQSLRRRSGERDWTSTLEVDGGPPVTSPVVAVDGFRRQVIVGDSFSYSRPRIAAFAERTGRLRWERRLTKHEPFEAALGDLAADRRAVYATGTFTDATHAQAVTTVALAPRSGRQRWIARHEPAGAETVGGYLRFRGGKLVVPFEGFPSRGNGMWAGYVTYHR